MNTLTQDRVPAGVTAGGQFSTTTLTEPDISLVADVREAALRAKRRRRYINGLPEQYAQPRDIVAVEQPEGGYLPAHEPTGKLLVRPRLGRIQFRTVDAVDRWVEEDYERIARMHNRTVGRTAQQQSPGTPCTECGKETGYDLVTDQSGKLRDVITCDYCGTERPIRSVHYYPARRRPEALSA
ncbi:hypothetical protein V5R04_06960 [Jonesiaceae bacterium BS-20]|uniref:Uncharacterized protein n=1 Tax=Jonesiaceae bacterium BS-20 TaxID=3120821 RepID=A0AAU7DZ16_9MICO